MGARGRERFQKVLAWSQQVPHLIAAYERALSKRPLDINLRRAGWWRTAFARRGDIGILNAKFPADHEPAGQLFTNSPKKRALS
jgi:hypothetical protein